VHGWDYAKAIGHQADVPDSLANYVLAFAEKMITAERRSNGDFAEPVEPPANSDAFDRLAAFTGRDPGAWGQTRSK
jgi:uncharacterized protein (TIGR03086 family)